MKKLKLITELLIGYIMGAGSTVGTYFLTRNDVDWQNYVETKLMPNIVAAIAAISALYIAALPVLKLIKKAASNFIEATISVAKTEEKDKLINQKLDNYEKRIKFTEEAVGKFADIISDELEKLGEKVSEVSENTEKIEEMSMIGFGNMSELVRGGYAAEIGKVVKNGKKTQH